MNKRAEWGSHLLAIFLLMVLCTVLVWPVVSVVISGFKDPDGGFTLFYFQSIFTNRSLLEGLGNSFSVALASTVLCAMIAIPIAWIMGQYRY